MCVPLDGRALFPSVMMNVALKLFQRVSWWIKELQLNTLPFLVSDLGQQKDSEGVMLKKNLEVTIGRRADVPGRYQ